MTLANTLFAEELDRRVHGILVSGGADTVEEALLEALDSPFPGIRGTGGADLFARLSEALVGVPSQGRVAAIRSVL